MKIKVKLDLYRKLVGVCLFVCLCKATRTFTAYVIEESRKVDTSWEKLMFCKMISIYRGLIEEVMRLNGLKEC